MAENNNRDGRGPMDAAPHERTPTTRLANLLNNITVPGASAVDARGTPDSVTPTTPPLTTAPNSALSHAETVSVQESADDKPSESVRYASASEMLSEQRHKGAEVNRANVNPSANTNADVNNDVKNDRTPSLPGFAETGQTVSAPNAESLPEDVQSGAITIKGRADGVLIEIGRGSWSELMEQLSERLRQAAGFFRGGKVTLNVGLRPLDEDELRQVRSLLEQFGMTLGVVRSAAEQTCQVAVAFGLAASLDTPDGMLAQPAATNHETLQHFVYRGNLRSGQVLRRAETVLILGDVNPGAQVVSHGDILVWGRLRGIAHAGATGDESAVIAALSMEPTQLRIASVIAILPEEAPSLFERLFRRRNTVKRPEIGYITNNQIVVESWDESKPGGIMAFRR